MKIWNLYGRTVAGVLVFCLLFSGVSAFFLQRGSRVPIPAAAPVPVFVLDAGHGGEDGGAVGVNGVAEKTLNLAIANMLGGLLEEAGYAVIYTRRTDTLLLYSEEERTYGKRKMYDLRNRLAVAEGTEGAILVSIHMNKFSVPKYSGLQVYYGENHADSRRLAETVRRRVQADLQPDNHRATKSGGEGIYLLHRATVPAILVECGFLSNPEECEKLSQKDYQRQLSFSLFCAMIEYIGEEGDRYESTENDLRL